MIESNRKPSVRKPDKPYPDFPLFPHDSGRWAKKIRGQIHYFGRWARIVKGTLQEIEGGGWVAALDTYQTQRDDLYAGRVPAAEARDVATIADLCNSFRASGEQKVQTGELTKRSLADYLRSIDRIIRVLGRRKSVESLVPDDFAELKADIAKSNKTPESLGNEINRCRIIFNHGVKNHLVDLVRYGDQFERPRKEVIRRARAAKRSTHGTMEFSPGEIKALLQASRPAVKAMILLGINCGFDNASVGQLRLGALDLDAAWLDAPREKTGTARQCPLWPETVEALRQAIQERPKAKSGCESHVFLTRCGVSWYKDDNRSPLSLEFRRLMEDVGCYRADRGFRALRQTFETVASGCRDQVAVAHVMGHETRSMAATHREHIERERLQAVVDHVHAWLWPPPKNGDDGFTPKKE